MNRILIVLTILWGISDGLLAFFRRSRRTSGSERKDRGSFGLLLVVIGVAIFFAFFWGFSGVGRFHFGGALWLYFGCSLIVAGGALRWSAVIALGRFFTVDVALHSNQRVVREGPYRFVRHPAYAGSLLMVLGLGLALRSWVSLLTLLLPIVPALIYRIRVEELVLREALGNDYKSYCKDTSRLLPGIW